MQISGRRETKTSEQGEFYPESLAFETYRIESCLAKDMKGRDRNSSRLRTWIPRSLCKVGSANGLPIGDASLEIQLLAQPVWLRDLDHKV